MFIRRLTDPIIVSGGACARGAVLASLNLRVLCSHHSNCGCCACIRTCLPPALAAFTATGAHGSPFPLLIASLTLQISHLLAPIPLQERIEKRISL